MGRRSRCGLRRNITNFPEKQSKILGLAPAPAIVPFATRPDLREHSPRHGKRRDSLRKVDHFHIIRRIQIEKSRLHGAGGGDDDEAAAQGVGNVAGGIERIDRQRLRPF